jgi:hypothetical protein
MGFKIGMVGILNNPSSKLTEIQRQLASEIYAPCTILTEHDNWNDYQYLIVNDFGKPGDLFDVVKRAEKLQRYVILEKGAIVKGPLIDYDIKEELDKMHCYLPPRVTIFELPLSRVINKTLIGDGHAVSVWPGPDHNIEIHREMPLADFLQDPTIADWYYFGNTDIRHHLCKEPDPVEATKTLAIEYLNFALKHKAKVTCLLPVESEKRIIPKSYKVDGKPFHGSRELRAQLVEVFNEQLLIASIACDLQVHTWPAWWYEKTYLYETTIMEPKPSVYVR